MRRLHGCVHIHVAVASWVDVVGTTRSDGGGDGSGGDGRGPAKKVAYRFAVEDNGPGIPRDAPAKNGLLYTSDAADEG